MLCVRARNAHSHRVPSRGIVHKTVREARRPFTITAQATDRPLVTWVGPRSPPTHADICPFRPPAPDASASGAASKSPPVFAPPPPGRPWRWTAYGSACTSVAARHRRGCCRGDTSHFAIVSIRWVFPPKQQAQNALVVAIARAHIWRDLLESGEVKNIAEIARANKVDGSYVSRIRRCSGKTAAGDMGLPS